MDQPPDPLPHEIVVQGVFLVKIYHIGRPEFDIQLVLHLAGSKVENVVERIRPWFSIVAQERNLGVGFVQGGYLRGSSSF